MRLREIAEEGKDKTKQTTKRNVKLKPWFLSFRSNAQV